MLNIIMKMQVNSIKRSHLTHRRMWGDATSHIILKMSTDNKCGPESEEKRALMLCWWEWSWCSHYGKQYGPSSKNLKLEPPYNTTIPLLDIYLMRTKTLIQKVFGPLLSLWHYLQYPRYRSKLGVYWLMNR